MQVICHTTASKSMERCHGDQLFMTMSTRSNPNTGYFDYHTHHVVEQGGYLNAVNRDDWERIAAAPARMLPCFGVHPWKAHELDDMASFAFDLDDWLVRYPSAGVGECGLDGHEKYQDSWDAQLSLFHIQLGAAFRHERRVHIHGSGAWSSILDILRERFRCGTLPVVHLHAWNGSLEMAREFLALGASFSVGLRELEHQKASLRYARLGRKNIHPESDDHPEHWGRICELYEEIIPV